MNRHTAREIALKMIFQMDVGKNLPAMAELTLDEAALGPELAEFASTLAMKAYEQRAELDKSIASALIEGWTVERLANVDKNILRIALYELYHLEGIPAAVTINEAIELAKTYAGADAPGFINGVLDKLAKNVEGGGRQ